MALSTERLKYLDLTSWLAAGTSLAKFYSAYKVYSPKGSFPYQYFNSIDRLQETELPKRDPELRELLDKEISTPAALRDHDYARTDRNRLEELVVKDPFYSILKLKTISNKDYDECEKEWIEQQMVTFADFVRFYNNHDVIGMVEGISKMLTAYEEKGLDVFKCSVSLPGLAQQKIFKELGDDYFTCFSDKHKHIFKEWKGGVVGGPSLIFCRYQERGITRIKNGETCRNIVGYAANSLSLNCMALEQCTGTYCFRDK